MFSNGKVGIFFHFLPEVLVVLDTQTTSNFKPCDPYRDRLFKIRDIMNMLKEKCSTQCIILLSTLQWMRAAFCSKEGSFSNNT